MSDEVIILDTTRETVSIKGGPVEDHVAIAVHCPKCCQMIRVVRAKASGIYSGAMCSSCGQSWTIQVTFTDAPPT